MGGDRTLSPSEALHAELARGRDGTAHAAAGVSLASTWRRRRARRRAGPPGRAPARQQGPPAPHPRPAGSGRRHRGRNRPAARLAGRRRRRLDSFEDLGRRALDPAATTTAVVEPAAAPPSRSYDDFLKLAAALRLRRLPGPPRRPAAAARRARDGRRPTRRWPQADRELLRALMAPLRPPRDGLPYERYIERDTTAPPTPTSTSCRQHGLLPHADPAGAGRRGAAQARLLPADHQHPAPRRRRRVADHPGQQQPRHHARSSGPRQGPARRRRRSWPPSSPTRRCSDEVRAGWNAARRCSAPAGPMPERDRAGLPGAAQAAGRGGASQARPARAGLPLRRGVAAGRTRRARLRPARRCGAARRGPRRTGKTPAAAPASTRESCGRRREACDLFLRWIAAGHISGVRPDRAVGRLRHGPRRHPRRLRLGPVEVEPDGVLRFVPGRRQGAALPARRPPAGVPPPGRRARFYRWSDSAEPAPIRFDEYDYETDDPRRTRYYQHGGRARPLHRHRPAPRARRPALVRLLGADRREDVDHQRPHVRHHVPCTPRPTRASPASSSTATPRA